MLAFPNSRPHDQKAIQMSSLKYSNVSPQGQGTASVRRCPFFTDSFMSMTHSMTHALPGKKTHA